MKKALALMLALAMIFSLAACGSTDQQPSDAPAQDTGAAQTSEATGGDEHEPVTLRIYVRYSDDDTILPYDYAVECLKEDMPWVTLELDAMPADDGVKLKSMVATGDLPDIFSLQGTDLINSMVQAGAVKDLTADIEENGFFDKVQPAAYSKLYHTDGKIYTLPYTSTEVALLFVNKAIFEENGVAIPTTIDEWVTASEELTAKGITVLPIFGKEQWICNTFYDALVTRYIPEGLTGLQQGTTSIRDEGYLKAAQDLERLAAAGAFPAGVTTLNYEQATNLWYNGEAAMFLNGQWEITTTVEYLGDKADWIPIPAARAERHAAHRVAAARGVHRGGHAALEELGLGYGHLRPALAERAGLESRHVGVVEVAHRGHIDVLVAGEYAALGARLGACIGARLIRRDRGRIHTAARGQRQHHRKTQCRRQCSLYPVCHHFLPLQIYIQMPPISAAFRVK